MIQRSWPACAACDHPHLPRFAIVNLAARNSVQAQRVCVGTRQLGHPVMSDYSAARTQAVTVRWPRDEVEPLRILARRHGQHPRRRTGLLARRRFGRGLRRWQQVCRLNAEHGGEVVESLEAHSPTAMLDVDEHVPRHTGLKRQRLLSKARPRSMFAHCRADQGPGAAP